MRNVKTRFAASVLLSTGLCIATWSAAEPPRVVPPAPVPAAARAMRPLAHAEATGMMLGALTRFANGTGTDGIDRSLAHHLARIPGARATAQRIVSRVQHTPIADRRAMLPGVADVSGGAPLDAQKYRAGLPSTASLAALTFNDRIQDQYTSGEQTQEIDYAGLSCTTPPQTVSGVAVYTAAITYDAPGTYVVKSSMVPASGSISGLAAGKVTTSGAGPALVAPQGFLGSAANWHNNKFIFLSALLPDDGALASHKNDVDVLIATAETFAAMATGDDRIQPLVSSLAASLNLLVLANPDKWSAHSVATTILDSGLANAPTQTTGGTPWKFQLPGETAGSNVQLLFNAQSTPTSANVDVGIDIQDIRLVLTGRGRGILSPLHLEASVGIKIKNEIAGVTVGHSLGQTTDAHVAWAINRRLLPGQLPTVTISLESREKGPSFQDHSKPSGWGYNGYNGFCADDPSKSPGTYNCKYEGPCPAIVTPIDLSPVNGHTWLTFTYDPATGAIAGDITGKRGAGPIVVTGDGEGKHFAGSITFAIH